MNKLVKLKLINWMYFSNETIDFTGNTVITGGNASGKSTILDAMQMLLLGNQKSRFNSNAEGQKRTLESYVRGAITTENKEFLRNGDVITYLCMQINKNEGKYIFGEYINYSVIGGICNEPKYFVISNYNIVDELFIDNNYPRSFDSLKKYTSELGIDFKPCFTLTEYQSKIREVMGLKNDRAYFRILKEAISIKNIQDINDFIYNFVLEDNKIDIDELNSSSNEMERLNRKIEKDLEKKELLENILNMSNDIVSNRYEISKADCLKDLANYKFNEIKIDEYTLDNKKIESKILESSNYRDQLVIELNNLNERKMTNENRLNQISPELKYKKIELENAYEKEVVINSNLETLELTMDKISTRLENIKDLSLSSIDRLIKYAQKKAYSEASLRNNLDGFTDEIKTYKEDYEEDIYDLANKEKDKIKHLHDLDSLITSYETNKIRINEKRDRFKALLIQTLYNKYKKQIDVNYLYELLDITNDDWRDAIEGYLANQRFDIIVSPEYYNDCLDVLEANKEFYEPKIVNTLKLPTFDFEENTLGSFIEATSTYALNYARYLLNRVHCVNNYRELSNFDIAMTKDCLKYQNYCVSRLNPQTYEQKLLGIESRKRTVIDLRRQYSKCENELNKIRSNKQTKEALLSSINEIIKLIDALWHNHDVFNSYDNHERIVNKITELEKYIKEFENNDTYIEIELKISEITKEISGKNMAIKSIEDDLLNYKASLKNNTDRIVEYNSKNKFINIDRFSDIIKHDANEEISKKDVNKELISLYFERYDSLLRKDAKLNSDIVRLMNDYNTEFLLSCEPIYESIDIYKKEYESLDLELIKYKSRSVELERSFRKAFINTFISRLYDNIEKAKKNIKDLNRKIDEFKIEKHEIKYSVSSDSDLAKIYNFAKSYGADRDLLNYENRDSDQIEVENIINRYMNSSSDSDKSRICDYRNYLDFDILIGENENRKSYKKVCKVQSGGEGQTPFYMLAAVAFMQTLDERQNDNLSIVLFDEVFDKMDPNRIREMLNLYNSFSNLQLIIALPKNIDSVSDCVSSIKVVCRNGENASVASYDIKNRNFK